MVADTLYFAVLATLVTFVLAQNERSGCACLQQYEPVCGSDGVTYGNRCEFRCAQNSSPELEIVSEGECEEVPTTRTGPRDGDGCICTLEYSPVCGSDGTTYGNRCQFKCAKNTNPELTITNNGTCGGDRNQNRRCGVCSDNYDPVCGSDGITYGNECYFRCAQTLNPLLTMAHTGACEGGQRNNQGGSCICTKEYNPVCGSDGVTYPNPCIFNCVQKFVPTLSIRNNGTCGVQPRNNNDRSCLCNQEYDPVCGSDGTTYSNLCQLSCVQMFNPFLTVAHSGPCLGAEPRNNRNRTCICTLEYNPVCGSDGITYGNHCQFNCAQNLNEDLSVVNNGTCGGGEPPNNGDRTCFCTQQYDPVCGSDGVTYSNLCQLMCAQRINPILLMTHTGPCVGGPRNNQSCDCSREYDPVCGSDGITYSNPCMFNCAQKINPTLTITNRGVCGRGSETESCICTREYIPVCGSDGTTYTNRCNFNCAQNNDPTLTIVNDGACGDGPRNNQTGDCFCTREYNPVCGSDGITYSNRCMFNCAQRIDPSSTIMNNGTCGGGPPNNQTTDCICTYEYIPVCGSDGITYGNRCQFNCAQNLNPGLTILRNGPCEGLPPKNEENGCVCADNFAPVCCSNNRTYKNRCQMDCERRRDPNLKFVRNGSCGGGKRMGGRKDWAHN